MPLLLVFDIDLEPTYHMMYVAEKQKNDQLERQLEELKKELNKMQLQ